MPLPVAHGLIGASLVAAWQPQSTLSRDWKPLVYGAALAVSPDLDLLLLWPLGLDTSWHRSFTHSIAFAIAVGCVAAFAFGLSRIREAIAYGSAVLSHGLLDYVATKKYLGVELFWPVSTERFKLGEIGLSEFASRDHPLTAIIIDWLKPCLIELMIFAPVFLAVLLLKRNAALRANRKYQREL